MVVNKGGGVICRSLIISIIVVSGWLMAPKSSADPDLFNGQLWFERCKVCHALTPGKNEKGPSLHGLFGRKSGTSPGYDYSLAMKKTAIVWTERTLDNFLATPKIVVPGLKMEFSGIPRPSDRRDLITFLKKTLASK